MKLRLSYILLLISFALQASADNYGYTKNQQLVFGIDMDYPPMEFVDEDTFMLTDYGAAHLYGIIPLFYSERSIKEMFAMSDRWLNDKKGEENI